MAVHDKNGLFQRLVELIRSNGVNGLTRAKDVRDMLTDLIDSVWSKLGEAASPAELELDWQPDVVYDTVNKPYAVYQLRIYKSKTDGNSGNIPPTIPDEFGVYENVDWVEISAAPTSGIASWKAGVFLPGLVIVEHNNQLLKLVVPDADRPFESSNIDTELTEDPLTTKWVVLTGGGDGASGKLRHDTYTTLPLASTIAWDVDNVAEGKAVITIPDGWAGTDIAFSLSNAADGFTGILALYNNDSVSHNINLPTAGIYAVSEGETASNAMAAGAITEFNFAHDGTKIKVTRGAFVAI